MMNHARIKELKGDGGKTVSNKAIKSGRASSVATPRSSPMASVRTSPAHSTVPSRVASDISEDESDFEDSMSVGSTESMLSNGEIVTTFDAEKFLQDLQDRKHINTETREGLMVAYIRRLRSRYTHDAQIWIDDYAQSLAEVFLRIANRGTEPRERLLALQSLILTISTSEAVEIFGTGKSTLQQILIDEDDEDCMANDIYALAFAVLYGGGGEADAVDMLEYFLAIIESDGENIEAGDNGTVVSAALNAWAFVASHVDDYSEVADISMDAFVEQLDSSDIDVQVATAHCIALVFESSRNHEEHTGEPFQLPYDPQRLAGRLAELAKHNSKAVSKKNRQRLRENLTSVITSLERGVGPGYSTAGFVPEKGEKFQGKPNEDGVVEFGYRKKLRLGNYTALIDTWSLSSRVDMMRTFFGGHLLQHVFDNPVVSECLSDADFQQNGATLKPPSKHSPSKLGKR